MKKRKGRDRKRKIPPIFLLIILSVSIGLILLSLYLSISSGSTSNPTPLYEEIYSSSAELEEKIKKIDYAVYESLYQSGVQDRDVFFLNVQPRHQNGYVWDFAEILVKCQDNDSVYKVWQIIDSDLTSIGEGIRLRKVTEAEGKIECQVFVNGFQTHKIILRVDSKLHCIKDGRPKIAIIVDDLGYDSDTDLSFFRLDMPLSFSVLPYGPSTRSVVRKANKNGLELILHLPMEPKNYPSVKPGPGGLFLSMDVNKLLKVLREDLRLIPGASGVNNHMGSSFTENREKMLVVLKELKKRGLYFIDSRTTKHTVGLDLARDIGLPAARRRIFLDNNLEARALAIQMERLLSMARHRGAVIGICHPYKETYRLLKRYRSKIKSEFQMVPVSELVS